MSDSDSNSNSFSDHSEDIDASQPSSVHDVESSAQESKDSDDGQSSALSLGEVKFRLSQKAHPDQKENAVSPGPQTPYEVAKSEENIKESFDDGHQVGDAPVIEEFDAPPELDEMQDLDKEERLKRNREMLQLLEKEDEDKVEESSISESVVIEHLNSSPLPRAHTSLAAQRRENQENAPREAEKPSDRSMSSADDFVRMQTMVKAENDLNYTQMIDKVLKSHPSKVVKGKRKAYSYCGTRTGWSLPCREKRKTGLKDLGVGVTLYFKFTKHLILLYLFMAIVTLPHVVFYVSGGTQDYDNNKTITSFFALTTLGNLGSAYTNCNFGDDFTSTISLYCTYGDISAIDIFGEGKSDGSSTCSQNGDNLKVDDTCRYSQFTDSEKQAVNDAFTEQCFGKSICDFDLSGITFSSDCDGSPYITISCESDKILGLNKDSISIILVIIDIVAIYFFWLFLQNHGKYEYLEEKEINGEVLNGTDFTVMIKNLPKGVDFRILKSKLWKHIETILSKRKDVYVREKNDPHAHIVADINFGMSNYGAMYYYIQRGKLVKMQTILMLKINILKDTEMEPNKKEKQMSNLQKRLEKADKKRKKNEDAFTKFKEKSKQTVVKAFVTFKSIEGKLRFMRLYHASWFTKLCCKKRIQSKFFEGKWLDVRQPAAPSLILWENLGVSRKERC